MFSCAHSPSPPDAALVAWQRQLQRRRQGVPTLSVVAATGDVPRWLVRRWAQANELPVCETKGGHLESMAAEWFAKLADSRNLFGAALARLSARTGQPPNELAAALAARSASQRALFFERTFGAATRMADEIACRSIIEQYSELGSTSVGLWDRLVLYGESVVIICGGLVSLIGAENCPVLHAMPETSEAVRTTVEALTRLVTAVPALVAVVSADSACVERYLIEAQESHASALVREGLVLLDVTSGSAHSADATIPSDGGSGPAEETTSINRTPAAETCPADRARSEAERYLFHRLESHPETAGLFELNGRVTRAIGGPCEIDLLARQPGVAIEIDGYYHFTDLDAYRRDRRKDVCLQQAGYLVVRCLADDVVGRLEEIVNTIVGAVRSRRTTRHHGPPREEPTR